MSTDRTFAAWRRSDGKVGVRNDLLILAHSGLAGPTARRVAALLPQAKLVVSPWSGTGAGADGALRSRLLAGLATHPNVGAVLVFSCNRPEAESFCETIVASGRPVGLFLLDDYHNDSLKITEAALRAGAGFLRRLSQAPRQQANLGDLCIGVECGRSDTTSGIAANPLVGHVADAVIAAGGTVIGGETLEWVGAEHLLDRRAAAPEISTRITEAIERRLAIASAAGINLIGTNPAPVNIAAGLSTLEEKSLGAVQKTGTAPIQGLLQHGEAPAGPGMWLMDQPSYSTESLTGFVAAGAQMVLFTTGPGNSYVSLLAPTVKLSANAETCRALTEQIDFDASAILTGETGFPEATSALLDLIGEVAGGMLTWGEVLSEGGETISRIGESL